MRSMIVGGFPVLLDDDVFEQEHHRRWRLDRAGYVCLREGGRRTPIYLHHVVIGKPPRGGCVDHINGNPRDNRRANLRTATPSQNQQNRRCVKSRSGYKGVTYHRGCSAYQAQLKHKGRMHYLGLYDSPLDAARAYWQKAAELFGEFAWTSLDAADRIAPGPRRHHHRAVRSIASARPIRPHATAEAA